MSDSEDSTVTYTEISSPYEDLSDIGSPGAEGPIFQDPPSSPELHTWHLRDLTHSPDYRPVYPEFLPVDDEVFPAEEQPMPAADSPTHQSPGYIPESDPEEDPEEDDEEDPEEDPADYPADRGDRDDEESSDDDDDAEEEHLAPADPAAVAYSADQDPYIAYRVTARMSIRPQAPAPFLSEEVAERLLALPTPPPSPSSPYSSHNSPQTRRTISGPGIRGSGRVGAGMLAGAIKEMATTTLEGVNLCVIELATIVDQGGMRSYILRLDVATMRRPDYLVRVGLRRWLLAIRSSEGISLRTTVNGSQVRGSLSYSSQTVGDSAEGTAKDTAEHDLPEGPVAVLRLVMTVATVSSLLSIMGYSQLAERSYRFSSLQPTLPGASIVCDQDVSEVTDKIERRISHCLLKTEETRGSFEDAPRILSKNQQPNMKAETQAGLRCGNGDKKSYVGLNSSPSVNFIHYGSYVYQNALTAMKLGHLAKECRSRPANLTQGAITIAFFAVECGDPGKFRIELPQWKN
ncbi:hypothetical protein Tco_0327631 [Tanacetum coccineum]